MQTNQDMENSNLTWTVSLQESHEMLPSLALINKNFTPNSPSLINSYYDSSLMIEKARQEISVANVKFAEWIDGEPIFLDRKPSKTVDTENIRKQIQKLKKIFLFFI